MLQAPDRRKYGILGQSCFFLHHAQDRASFQTNSRLMQVTTTLEQLGSQAPAAHLIRVHAVMRPGQGPVTRPAASR